LNAWLSADRLRAIERRLLWLRDQYIRQPRKQLERGPYFERVSAMASGCGARAASTSAAQRS
jgi:hypothetical protein